MSSSNPGHRREAAILLLLAALTAGLCVHRIHLERPGAHGFEDLDLVHYFYPTAVFVHDELREGRLPLWNPYQFAGQPYLGLHVPGALYPPNLILMALLPPALALEVHFALHLVIAGFGSWLFAARLGLGREARVAAAVGYMLSGPLMFGVYNVTFHSTQAWLPGILWALHGLLTEARGRWAVGLAVFASLSFLGGQAQQFLYAAQFALVYGLVGLAILTAPELRGRVLGLAVLGGLLALGLTGPQLLPALELTREATRSFAGLTLEEASLGSMPPERIVKGLLGRLGKDPEVSFLTIPIRGPRRWLVTLPLVGLPLIACGLMARRQRFHFALFTVAAAGAALFMMGSETPVFRIYHALPLGNLFRIPSRMAFVYAFLVAVLAAIGIEGAAEGLRASRAARWLPRIAATFLALTLAVDFYTRTDLHATHPVLSPPIRGGPAHLTELLEQRRDRPRAFIQSANPELLYKVGMINRVFAVPDYEPNLPASYARYFGQSNEALWHGFLSVLPERRHRPAPLLARLLDLMSVRFYATLGRPGSPHVEALREFVGGELHSVGPLHLIERDSAMPRAYAVRRIIRVSDADAALLRIEQDSFDPLDEAVVIDPDASLGEAARAADPGAPERSDAVEIASYSPQEIEIEVDCGAPCLLVLTDLHYPGWHAYVDSIEAEVRRTNALFRGVELSPGAHRVLYRFEPGSFRIGLATFFTALLGAAVASLRRASAIRGSTPSA